MKKINTVLGAISADEMGPTLMHEHLLWAKNGWQFDALAPRCPFHEIVDICAATLGEVKQFGVKTVVNASPIDNGRDVDVQKAVSEKTGVHMICATGFFNERGGQSHYLKFRSRVADIVLEMYETYMQEITVGIGKTGIKAGFIKTSSGLGSISPYEEKVLKAAAKAQKETGVPIITHTENGTMGPEQAELLIGEGVDPGKIVIGHMSSSKDREYLLSVLDKGVTIGFDNWGVEIDHSDEIRKSMIVGLLGMGFADRIVLSQDYKALVLGRPLELPQQLQARLANWSYTHIFKNILPQLKSEGLTEAQIETMLVSNPMSIFGG